MTEKKLTEKLPEQCGGCPDLKENWEDYDPCNCEEFCEVVFERGIKAGKKAEQKRILEMIEEQCKTCMKYEMKKKTGECLHDCAMGTHIEVCRVKEIEKLIRGDDK